MTTSNAVEYERKRDAITDLKEDYKSYRRSIRVLVSCDVVSIVTCITSLVYGVINSAEILPPILFAVTLILSIVLSVGSCIFADEKGHIKRKQIRDAEREFKYWSIENPPC